MAKTLLNKNNSQTELRDCQSLSRLNSFCYMHLVFNSVSINNQSAKIPNLLLENEIVVTV